MESLYFMQGEVKSLFNINIVNSCYITPNIPFRNTKKFPWRFFFQAALKATNQPTNLVFQNNGLEPSCVRDTDLMGSERSYQQIHKSYLFPQAPIFNLLR